MSFDKPFVNIHSLISLNGKMVGPYWNTENGKASMSDYEWTSASYNIDAWLWGRKTFDAVLPSTENPPVNPDEKECPDGDYYAVTDAKAYVVGIDPSGKLPWDRNTIKFNERPEAHVIEILTEKASPQYKNLLRRLNVSYIVAGKEDVDWKTVMSKLKKDFHINVLSVEGGGMINWSVLKAKIVDEVSLLLSATADATNSVSLFEANPYMMNTDPVEFTPKSIEKINSNGIWIKYTPKY
ncbi:hypothetical protein TVAG_001410 [Trichomonas vaginalis G3]|uniref:Bacterial bifunctional deaminase-reductase C-terminal domain-containing protein n=1 Tax=Trichomonas vaginalis (strain ATCC PRA-98 / G3) TaxID=412133 RepID=A2GFX9_TRIV3|nr:cupin domain-containing protein family [Trichomonas vaginalis G3]EAX83938.1 hypothetical protein TVAG_001410 [Trichomonas vaginalis G3]KAI5526246.1 cupin domain-containing protein family [Trichomonas vaginalis G3]|eukprot:XP_001296868.1 hypothetical protein [Trichomonas vaginalis G3]